MRNAVIACATVISAGCAAVPVTSNVTPAAKLAAAESLIDAFYSFDPVRLRTALVDTPQSAPQILYYQGWAEGGNYIIVDRKPCAMVAPDRAICDITVKDDLIGALGTGYNVTDRFQLGFQGSRIVNVQNSSNDPPEFKDAMQWLAKVRPELMTGACRGFFDGGPTPKDCVRAVVSGFTLFAANRRGQR